jgi:hydrogenase expression/formation protein HypD
MIYLHEFRNRRAARVLLDRIADTVQDRPVRFMEVCGGHTMAIWRYGLPELLGKNVTLLSGPGCPVCVTPNSFLDRAIALSRRPDVTIVTFGDLMRVPGSSSDLQTERARGSDIRPVYSSIDALEVACRYSDRIVIFLGVGFETTAPTIAATINNAQTEGLKNFRILSALKTMPQALRALVAGGEIALDGLILPGHVSAITGSSVFDFLSLDFGLPCVVSGFEPLDLLQSILMLGQQVSQARAQVEIQYSRTSKMEGNLRARQIMDQVFAPADAEWRGLGVIPGSGLSLRPEYAAFDAFSIPVKIEPTRENPGCRCGEVIRGAIRPEDCRLFGQTCKPEHPIGACMVSEEGSCAAHYKYRTVDHEIKS